jgi:hypothetical protein
MVDLCAIGHILGSDLSQDECQHVNSWISSGFFAAEICKNGPCLRIRQQQSTVDIRPADSQKRHEIGRGIRRVLIRAALDRYEWPTITVHGMTSGSARIAWALVVLVSQEAVETEA